ncbi:MAG: FG-GAP repeat protein [Anaerolineaceae bacterium]|nr:FG-GAP repeat protein [Anaerolineaceae bacterium]
MNTSSTPLTKAKTLLSIFLSIGIILVSRSFTSGHAEASPNINSGGDLAQSDWKQIESLLPPGAIRQDAYLKASNTDANDLFGTSVAISGNTAVVGSFFEDSAATGIDGDQTDNSATDSGAVYVFVRTSNGWSQQAYLKASNTNGNDYFGQSVAISGDTIVIGAYGEDSAATGINGDQSDNSASFSGAAYIFTREDVVWSQQAYLKASNTQADDLFGMSVAIDGDTVVIAAPGEDSASINVNGNQSDNSASYSGAAYIFTNTNGTWGQQAYLKASNTNDNDKFGSSIGISGDTIIVGAYCEDSNATGVNGVETDNSASDSGAAYIFSRANGQWTQQAYLKASNTQTDDWFGISVAVSGDTAVVGANKEDSSATGVNGDESNNAALDSGSVYVFTRTGVTWSQQSYLKASNTGEYDHFGRSVAVAEDNIVVGAYREGSAADEIDGDQSDDPSYVDAGAAYVFNRMNNIWEQRTYIKASNTGGGDRFGMSTAIHAETIVIGAPSENSNATGVNGDQLDNSAFDAGSAYIFGAYVEKVMLPLIIR